MDTATQGIVLFVLTSLVVATITHSLVRSFLVASLIAAITSSVLFIILATIHDRSLDKFFLVAFMVCAFFGFIISLLVGLPFTLLRQKNKD
jgi:hypothetical protein